MDQYQPFVDQLEQHLLSELDTTPALWKANSVRLLNGKASEELRRLVDLETRRSYGAFFTDSELADQVFAFSALSFDSNVVFYDPAVGAGNLLLAGYRHAIDKAQEISLLGTDIHETFIRATDLRLAIEKRFSQPSIQANVILSTANGLVNNRFYDKATHILTNPPFNLVEADKTSDWCKGKVSAAAVFIDKIINYVKPGAQILAILPEVLRSGSRYAKWRDMVQRTCSITRLQMLGQFDRYADVDVFSVVLTKRSEINTNTEFQWTRSEHCGSIIAEHFEISVGSVVDNRDPMIGEERPFIVSRGLPGWQVVKDIDRKRRFSGRSIKGPFVLIKRTSRMSDKYRATATIINIHEPVFIDNHLIVAKPKSGNIADCHRLIKLLAKEATNTWINEQIRCRHLTVKIVERIPYNA